MKEKVIKISLFCIIIALAILGLYQIASYEVKTTSIQALNFKEALSTNTGTLADGEKDPDSYEYNINTGTWNATKDTNEQNSFNIPYHENFQIYCIEPGGSIRYSNSSLSIQAAKAYIGNYTLALKHEYEVTVPVFIPTADSPIDLPPAATYIISASPIGEWSEEKQKAIWNLREYIPDLIVGTTKDEKHDGESIYDTEAKNYAEYDSLVRDVGLLPTDQTTNLNVLSITQTTDECTVGPLNIKYTNGTYGDVTFAGISEMTVIGYNSKGEQVKDDIEITGIILKNLATGLYGKAQTPQYFEPDIDLKVDYSEQVYPASGQDFKIVFKNPNSGLSVGDENYVVSISIKVKFKYMLANGQYTKLKGVKYQIRCNTENETAYLQEIPQQYLMAADAIRSIYEQEIEIRKSTDTGSYNIKLTKVDSSNSNTTLSGATFRVAVSYGTETYYTTNSKGQISLSGTITEAMYNRGSITILMIETSAPTGYELPSLSEIRIVAKIGTNAGRYVITEIECHSAYADAILSGDTIVITAKNSRKVSDGLYNISLEKVDYVSQTYLSGAEFEIIVNGTTSTYATTDSNGQINISGTITEAMYNKGSMTITVKETKAPDGYAMLSENPIEITAKVYIDETYKKYSIKDVEITSDNTDGVSLWTTTGGTSSVTISLIVQNDRVISLGGYVWEDIPEGKENLANGQKDEEDKVIPNVKVTLYSSDGKLATLKLSASEVGISEEDLMHRVNPTYTDSNGYYQFDGIDPTKKYYVTFEYNGQIYMPTKYLNTLDGQYTSVNSMINAGLYNTDDWKITSKGTEKTSERTEYNNKFAEIGSSPLNYVSSNSLNSGKLVSQNGVYYNEAYSQYDLMGFVLDENGIYYKDESLALIDGFYKIEDGCIVETDELQEGIISKKIKEIILEYYASPTDEILKNIIYKGIVDDNTSTSDEETEMWRKLQFIEDCKITSYTQGIDASSYDLYPKTSDVNEYYINQGLWRRQETDLALKKDIAYAATRINGKTEVYTYDTRSQITNEEKLELARLRAIYEQDRTNTANYQAYLDYVQQIENKYYWEIQLRMQEYNNYYASTYIREIYTADYAYRSSNTNNSGSDLELYITYKITIRNSSTSILSQITEIVDYYDQDYIYMDDLSWIMYKNDSNGNNAEISLSAEDYYNTIDQLSLQGDLKQNAKDVDSYDSSRYGLASQQDMNGEYNSLYIRGLDSKKLASGEEAYIYLTFKVKSDSEGPVILDNDNSLKQNFVEINGYTTYYRDGTELPNNQKMSSNSAAGLIDIDSNPGNISLDDLEGEKYEKNFEDDTDRAKSIKVTLNSDYVRSINGIVWEDQRTENVAGSIIGDGIRQTSEIGIQGITVELVEKLADGSEYVWQTTTTDENGYYEFKTDESGNVYIIPGNYIIRFHYGDTESTVLTSANGGANIVSYNGQDFKSTVYQQDLITNTGLANYTEEYYDIQALDALGSDLSDAKDIWSRREEVNNYSKSNVTNYKAEVLASPYADSIDSALINELIENTNMIAETAIIVLEGEYNRTNTDANSNLNGNYTLKNVDFGLTERPKAQLELSKKITNVKVTLANGTTLFDTSKSATDLTWAAGKTYNLSSQMSKNKYEEYYNQDHRYAYRTNVDELVASKYDASHNNGLIKIDMDDELMHGATIKISYDLTVTNVGETDYIGQDFYYKGTGASEKVTTTANVVLDYVANNLQYRAENNTDGGWSTVNDAINTAGINSSLSNAVAKCNTIIETEKLASKLKPGETTTVELVLTQLMTSQNTADDRTYNNIAEITTISNSVGRRMAYSIQGNQDPTAEEPAEVDSVKSEEIIVIPPTGIGEMVTYIALAIVVLVILIGGIILIKKKVLKK